MKPTPEQEAIHYLRMHSGSERPIAEREAAVSMIINRIPARGHDAVAETMLNAIYYLRAGKFPFCRSKKPEA